MQDFRNVRVWQKAHELTLRVYETTLNFPKEELFGLRTQLRKTVSDIPAYIAEGCGKSVNTDFARCLNAALSFGGRLEYYFLLARDLKMLSEDEYKALDSQLVEVKKMLNAFMQKVISNQQPTANG